MSHEWLLISDLDGTLLGDDEALRRLDAYQAEKGARLRFVYASGRFFQSIREDIRTTPLPEPAAVIGGVGSEIRSYPSGDLNEAWVEKISRHWSADTVRRALAADKGLELQPESEQSAFKVSYILDNASKRRLELIRKQLSDAGVEANLIYSSDRDLDVLPNGVNKGAAAKFIAEQLGYEQNQVVVAGNSGNDACLFEHNFRGVIVANAHDDLKRFQNEPSVYLSPKPEADGVRDGLKHWIER